MKNGPECVANLNEDSNHKKKKLIIKMFEKLKGKVHRANENGPNGLLKI